MKVNPEQIVAAAAMCMAITGGSAAAYDAYESHQALQQAELDSQLVQVEAGQSLEGGYDYALFKVGLAAGMAVVSGVAALVFTVSKPEGGPRIFVMRPEPIS